MNTAVGSGWTAERIKSLRGRLGYDQAQMAEALGFSSYRRISELENGKREPSAPIVRLLNMLEKEASAKNGREE